MEYTPPLFSDKHVTNEINEKVEASDSIEEENQNNSLFDQDTNEEDDFEIPAFLRRQKF